MTPVRIILLTLALAGGALLAGCRSDEPFDIPLLFEHEPQEDLTDDTIPLLFSDWERDLARDRLRVHVLWPLLRYEREGRESQTWLLGVPVARDRIDHRGFMDVDRIYGPVLWGHSPDEGSYLSILPLGGTMRGLLGKSYVLGVVPPLFLYTEDHANPEFTSTHVLFPFVNWWSGGGRSGFRVFPFYAHYERKDVGGRLAFRRTWILWPFWQTLENNINSPAGAQTMWFFFPFYGSADGPDTHSWTLLFPFFKYFENRGSSYGGPLYDLRAPFPFVRIVRGRQRSQTDFWPFFGVKERTIPMLTGSGGEHFERRFILWPIWQDQTHDVGEVHSSRWWALPLLWSYHTENEAEGTSHREFKLWPLFRYKRWPDGTKAVNVLSPLWFQDPEGAFERTWGAVTRVWHEWREPEGARRLELLFGLYGEREFTSPDGPEVARTSVFFGMFQYERRGTEKELRFFWLPFGPSWGDENPPPKPPTGRPGGGSGGQRTPG